jgi:hypothetical protein
MPEVGDRVRVRSTKIGQAEREGMVTQVMGNLLRVQWSTGEESTFTPGPGSLTVVGRKRAASKNAAAASTKKTATAGNEKTAKRSVAKRKTAQRKAR